MTKNELVEALRKKGYDAYMDVDVPMIRTNDAKLTVESMQKILDGLDYKGSFGVHHGGAKTVDSENVAEESATEERVTEDATTPSEETEAVAPKMSSEETAATQDSATDDYDDSENGGTIGLVENDDGQMSFF